MVEINGVKFLTDDLPRKKIPVKIGQGGINRGFFSTEAPQKSDATLRHFKETSHRGRGITIRLLCPAR